MSHFLSSPCALHQSNDPSFHATYNLTYPNKFGWFIPLTWYSDNREIERKKAAFWAAFLVPQPCPTPLQPESRPTTATTSGFFLPALPCCFRFLLRIILPGFFLPALRCLSYRVPALRTNVVEFVNSANSSKINCMQLVPIQKPQRRQTTGETGQLPASPFRLPASPFPLLPSSLPLALCYTATCC
jgi:hypothetical protein